jgi:hypothetical protein
MKNRYTTIDKNSIKTGELTINLETGEAIFSSSITKSSLNKLDKQALKNLKK